MSKSKLGNTLGSRWNSVKGLFTKGDKSQPSPEISLGNSQPPEVSEVLEPTGPLEPLKLLDDLAARSASLESDHTGRFGKMSDQEMFESLLISAVASFIVQGIEPSTRTMEVFKYITDNASRFVLTIKEDFGITTSLTRKQLRRKLEAMALQAKAEVVVNINSDNQIIPEPVEKEFDA